MYPVLFYRYGPLILCHFMSAQILSVTQSSLQFPLWSCSQFHQPSSSCLPWKFLNKRADNSNPQTLGLLCLHLHSWILWKFTGQSVVNWLTSNKTELILKGSKAFERRGSEIQNPRNTGRGRILKSLRQKPRQIWEIKRLVDVNELSFDGPSPNISIALENTLGKRYRN